MCVTPEEVIDGWKTETEVLREFFDAQPKIPGWGTHPTEAFGKFKRAGMALQKFRTYELELRARGVRHSDDVEPLGFYAEAFYYFAWRSLKLLGLVKARRSNGQEHKPFKGVDRLVVGVRLARNQMLEHTDKPDGVPDLVSEFFSPKGWVMALDVHDEHGQSLDQGLWANAEQLISILRQRITEAVAAGRKEAY